MYLNEIGHFSLILSFCFSAILLCAGIAKLPMRIIYRSSIIIAVLSSISLAILVMAFIQADFSLKVVYTSSHTNKPLLYRISSLWSGHEGSLMLWLWMLLVSLAVCARKITDDTKDAFAITTGGLSAVLLLFVLLFSSPWVRISETVLDGQGLNPLLQDPFLAIHPPLLYMGYTGLTVPFILTLSTLMNKGRTPFPFYNMRAWTLYSWIFLTLGIGFGSYWAWIELGWGGFWFWDPVENSSLMPWLATTALMHSLLLVHRKSGLKIWSLFLSIVAFALSILGMFLVRSGILTSVHAFASDPSRGLAILLILLGISGIGFTLLALFGNQIQTGWEKKQQQDDDGSDGSYFEIQSKEGYLIINNWILISIALVVLLGTLWPVLDPKISAGAPFFNLVLSPFAGILLVLAAFAPLTPWNKGKPSKFSALAAMIAMIAAIIMTFIMKDHLLDTAKLVASFIGVFCSVLVIAASLMIKGPRYGKLDGRLHRFGIRMAHLGFGLCALAIVGAGLWTKEQTVLYTLGQSHLIGAYEIRLDDVKLVRNDNYQSSIGQFSVLKDGQLQTIINSERRFYLVERQDTTEAGIRPGIFGTIYIALGQSIGDDQLSARLRHMPLMDWLWIGSILMVLGVSLCLIAQMITLYGKRKD